MVIESLLNFDFILYLSEPDVILEKIKNIVQFFSHFYILVIWFELILLNFAHLKYIMGCKNQLLQANSHHLDALGRCLIQT